MKNTLLIVGSVSVLALIAYATTKDFKPVLVFPEDGITCVWVEPLVGKKLVPAGCYTGDVHSENELNPKAMKRYQSHPFGSPEND